MRDRLDVLPGGQHVEDHAVHAALLGGPQHRVDVADAQVPRGVTASEPQVHVRRGDVGKVLATLHGDQVPLRADGVQERH